LTRLGKIVSTGAVLLAGMGLAAQPATATSSPLPLPAFGDIVVDQAHKHIFISGGRSANSVLVLDFSGRVLKKIDNQFGATGLVLSEDNKTLYVAQAAGDAVSAVSTDKFIETTRYPTGAQTCPTHLARTGSLVWFGYGCDDTWNGRIGKLDVAATPPITLDQQGDALFQRAPLVSSNGAAAGPVVAGQLELSLSNVHVYSVAGATLAPGAAGEVVGSNLTAVAVSPDGLSVYTASGSRDHVAAFATHDLSGRGSYSTGAYPNAVAPTGDGKYVATGAYTSRIKAVTVFEVGETVPAKTFSLDGSVLANRGLAWSADNQRLFAVLQGANDPRPRLTVLD
jgi:DNA-binding beta-propeller fold protein YncE